MFRNMLKRSWLSVRRKLGRTIVLVLFFFMMANHADEVWRLRRGNLTRE